LFALPPSPQEFSQMELLAREAKEDGRCMSDDYVATMAR